MQKKQAVPVPRRDDWTIDFSYRVNGRVLDVGVEVTIRGERGRFRFQRAISTDKGAQWLDFIGGLAGHEQWRSFRVDRVRTVHIKRKTRPGTLSGKTPGRSSQS